MNIVLLCALALSAASSAGGIAGHVVAASAAPVGGARVFVEPGLGGAILETATGPDGSWRLDAVPAENPIGVFAIADGFGFGGTTLTGADADTTNVVIALSPTAAISGTITDPKKRPIAGARVTRIGILGETKVGIPFAKLKPFGFDEPVSDNEGRFTIPRLPEHGRVALKVAHPEYAQEAVDNVAVGEGSLRVVLYAGVLVEGDVLLRDDKGPIADVPVVVRNAQPPHDTAVTRTNAMGAFALRLKPGVYLCQAATETFRSPGWQQLTITGEAPEARLKIFVAGVGRIRGKVCDAVSGAPITAARLTLETQGNLGAVARTGPTGEFDIPAAEGESVLRLDSAPGYQAPEQPALKVQVVAGKEIALPTFWLAPIPAYTVTVVDDNMKPVSGAVITILRPLQFGWRVTDAQGQAAVRLASIPPDGSIMGMVEDIAQPRGALFAIRREDAGQAKVQLFALGSVRGRVVTDRNRPVEGVIVAGLFGEGGLTLWRTVTNADGAFSWDSVIPQVPQRVVVYAGEDAVGEGTPLTADVGASVDLGDVTAPKSARRASMLAKPLAWPDQQLLCGTLVEPKKFGPAVVVYCAATDAAMVIEGLAHAREILDGKDLQFAVLVDAPFTSSASPIPVLSGAAPGPATTYLIGSDGTVQLETFGMPPLRAVQRLLSAK